MKKRLLSLTIVGLLGFSAVALSACDSSQTTPTTPAPVSVAVSTLAITNKEALQAEWGVGQDNRLIEIKADGKEFNVSQALANKNLVITTSNADSVGVVGAYIIAKGIGKATITVTYGGKSDTVEVEALKRDTAPGFIAGTMADVAAADGNAEDIYVVPATVVSTSATGTKVKAGDVEYDIALITADATKLQYDIANDDDKPTIQSFSIASDAVAVTDLAANDALNLLAVKEGTAIKAILLAKNGKGVIHFDTNTDDLANQVMDSVIIGAANKAFYYRVTGVVTQWQYADSKDGGAYGNVTIKTEGCENAVLIYGCTMTESALTFSDAGGTFAFKNPKDFLTNETSKTIAIGDTITIEGFRCDYKGVSQLNGIIKSVVKATA